MNADGRIQQCSGGSEAAPTGTSRGITTKDRKKRTGLVLVVPAIVLFLLLMATGCGTLKPEPINSHDFGEVYVGQAAVSPEIVWRNNGDDAMEVLALVPSPFNTTFDLSEPFRQFQGPRLEKGEATQPVTFTFTPPESGSFSAEVTPHISGGNQGLVQPLKLKGTGICQKISPTLGLGGRDLVEGQPLDFGRVDIRRGRPIRKTFNLINTGNEEVHLTIVQKGSRAFEVLSSMWISVPARDDLKVTVQFVPRRDGRREGVRTGVVEFVNRMDSQLMAGTALRGEGVTASAVETEETEEEDEDD